MFLFKGGGEVMRREVEKDGGWKERKKYEK